MSAERSRIGIFGGSFHPPHEGHLYAARTFMDKAALDFLFVIPAHIPPHKTLAEGAKAEDRFEMARIAFAPLGAKVRLLRCELEKDAPSYTVDTLRELSRDFPESDFYLYIGSDLLFSFEQWHDFRAIFPLCTLAVMARENDEEKTLLAAQHLQKTYGARILYLGIGKPMSSGAIRQKLFSSGHSNHLSPHVSEYIENRGLYRKEEP